MNRLSSVVAGTLFGGALIVGGAEAIAATSEGPSSVEQVNDCAKHLGNYAVGVVSAATSKQEAEALKADCQQFETAWTPTSVNLTKIGTKTLVLELPDVEAFSNIETPPAKVADDRRQEIKIAESIFVGILGTIGGVAVYRALSEMNFGFPRRKRAGTSPTA